MIIRVVSPRVSLTTDEVRESLRVSGLPSDERICHWFAATNGGIPVPNYVKLEQSYRHVELYDLDRATSATLDCRTALGLPLSDIVIAEADESAYIYYTTLGSKDQAGVYYWSYTRDGFIPDQIKCRNWHLAVSLFDFTSKLVVPRRPREWLWPVMVDSPLALQLWLVDGGDLNHRDPVYGSPLECAIIYQSTECIALLISRGAYSEGAVQYAIGAGDKNLAERIEVNRSPPR